MFEVPEAKRVKRSELFNDDSDSSISTTHLTIEEQDRANNEDPFAKPDYGFDYDFVQSRDSADPQSVITSNEETNTGATTQQESQTFEFRLFAAPSTSTTSKNTSANEPHAEPTSSSYQQGRHLISIRSPTPPPQSSSDGSGRFIKPTRPQAYYLTAALPQAINAQRQHEFAISATSGEEVLFRGSTTTWPGTEQPWRVISVKLQGKLPTDSLMNVKPVSSVGRRCKPSKKRRILLRRRTAEMQASRAQAMVVAEEQRAKRTKKNRDKQIKKRAREKLKKAEAAIAIDEVVAQDY